VLLDAGHAQLPSSGARVTASHGGEGQPTRAEPRVAAHGEPFARFVELLELAQALPRDCMPEPTAFSLATVSADGAPSVRIVLLKSVGEKGFTFYTNYESRKGRELLATRRAAMCFHWMPLEVQVRIEGRVESVTDEEADAYFA